MRQRGLARSLGITLVAVVVIGLVGFLVTRPAVPYPAESRRVIHPAGFSVVAPPDWVHQLTFADGRRANSTDSINIVPSKAVRSNASLLLVRLAVQVTPQGLAQKDFVAATFQGKPAYTNGSANVFMKDHARALLFERDGVWYELRIRVPELEALDAGVWLAYAESFRVEAGAHAVPATMPVQLDVTTKPAP